ncbi:MAG: Rieske (2Fe-2S) protein [Flavobacteriaceae bacterium]|nr:Rieske (2Fe-2S) protein [Flavobacteriaceae bacterium]
MTNNKMGLLGNNFASFMKKWHRIYDFSFDGPEPQKLHTVRTVEVNGFQVCLARLQDGYFAVNDVCPHAGHKLGQGICTHDGRVICPYHRYTYDLRSGQGDPQQGDRVGTFPVETRADGVYIAFEEEEKKRWGFW